MDTVAASDTVPVYHVITPGDHYSPRTGSASPTVVHGLAAAALREPDERYRHHVVLQQGTYRPRYSSAETLEYPPAGYPTRRDRLIEAALARFGAERRASRQAYLGAVDVLARSAPGIVIAHNAPQVGAMLQGSGHRVVLYAHNALFRSYSRRERARTVETFDAVVCVSEDMAGELRRQLPARVRARVEAVVHGVDVTQFSPRNAHVDGVTRIVFVGRIIKEKGVDVLLRATEKLGSRPGVEVVIVGSQGFAADADLSRYESRLRSLAQKSATRVAFRPFVDRTALPSLLRDSDILVVPSRWREPCGLTTGEGLASGLAVVASAVGGIPEVLGDAGVLVPPGDVDALAHALTTLLDDPGLRGELSRRARERAEERDWTWAWRNLRGLLDSLRGTQSPS